MKRATETLVEMKGVKLSLANKEILKGVDLSVHQEEVLVVLGTSGGGKSTLLNIMTGLLRPNAGSVMFKGEDVTRVSRSKLNQVRQHIGMVFQNGALISSMNVRDNVALPLSELSGKSEKEIASIVDEKLEMVGLKDAGTKLPSELSGGMQKRAGLARALAMDPELVLFDEPSAGLDPVNTKLIDDLIISLRKEHKVTSVVVTHEMDSAFAVATRMAFLDKGKFVAEGTPDEFLHSKTPALREFLAPYFDHDHEHSKD